MPILSKRQGDLVKMAKAGRFTHIVHGCNTMCVMGSGIAPQIANAFEGVREADNDFPLEGNERLGDFSHTEGKTIDDMPVWIINAYTQAFTGCSDEYYPPVSYRAIKEVFGKINNTVRRWSRNTGQRAMVGIPYIGAGLAGGDWEIIRFLIDSVTPDIHIVLVEYAPEG